ncbi:hypothetical protein [Methylobacterium nigriterrae]|uniref:hypothetical protein n=1 Tax=Methylobacterium nigriterrae TaxID=3127512 RepID=UPI003013777A
MAAFDMTLDIADADEIEPAWDPEENSRRVRAGLVSLLAGRPISFTRSRCDLIVVFSGSFTKFSGGRVHLFQQHVLDGLGIYTEIVKQIPACIKVFFVFHNKNYGGKAEIQEFLTSQESMEVYENLGITQIQLGGEIIFKK